MRGLPDQVGWLVGRSVGCWAVAWLDALAGWLVESLGLRWFGPRVCASGGLGGVGIRRLMIKSGVILTPEL